MAGLIAIGAMLAIIGYYLLLVPPATTPAKETPDAEAVATAMLVYQKAAVDWCLRGACPDGPVPGASLVLPPGFDQASWLHALASSGRVATYADPVRPGAVSIAASLGDLTSGGPSAGLAAATATINARDLVAPGRVAAALPPGIPAGMPVVAEKVK